MESVKKGKVDVVGVQETHRMGCSVMKCMEGNECEIGEGMEGRVM